MLLRQKVLVTTFIIIVLLVAISFTISQAIIMRSYSRLEDREMEHHLARVTRALQEEIDALTVTALDWAAWDDTYEYMIDHNEDYMDANLVDDTWLVLEMNIVLFVDTNEKIVFGRAYDLVEEEEIPLPSSLVNQLDEGLLLNDQGPDSSLAGWINLPEGLMMLAAQPITTTEYEGPVHGTLLFGRFLTEERITRLNDLVRADASFWSYENLQWPEDVQAADLTLSWADPVFTQAINQDTFAGYMVINDLFDQPAQIVRVEMSRDIYDQGRASQLYLFAAIGVVTLAFLGSMFYLLERMVLARLSNLGAVIQQLQATDDMSVRVPLQGQDEITQLGQGFNDLLNTLSKTHSALVSARDELEIRVAERTAQLETSNQQLQNEIVERQRAQQEVAAARDQALEALRVKTQILANVSHDARTPLSVIVLRTQYLQKRLEGTLSDRDSDIIDSILASAFQLTTFTENLLNEARAQNKKIVLTNTSFCPAALLDEIRTVMGLMADRKGLTLKAEVADGVSRCLTGDVEHLKQILLNLTDNAIKFTEQGSVTMRITQPDDTHWTLQVSDTGPGIAEEDQQYIFESFYQADGSLTRTVNRGVGLGLSIVKGLATLMGAEIAVESALGQGSTFTIIIPIEHRREIVNDKTHHHHS